jgi:DNA mismatch repair enzyme MutH
MNEELDRIKSKLDYELGKYYGLSFNDLANVISLNVHLIKGKASTFTVVNKMIKNLEPYTKTLKEKGLNLAVKSVVLKENGVPKESMSFEQIDFFKVVQERWEESFVRKKFMNTVFCFFVFQKKENNLYFKGVKVWKMREDQLEKEVRSFWKHLKKIITEGVKIERRKRGSSFISVNNLPSTADNPIMHVRPKAKDSNDTVELPCGKFITRHAYWFNASFVARVLKDMPTPDFKQTLQITEDRIAWNGKLQDDIYTIKEVVNIGNSIKAGYTELNIDPDSFAEAGYRIESSFIIREDVNSLDEYLQQRILSGNYFDYRSDAIFDTPYVRRKIENYENAYKLLKVENSLYLTETGMKSAQVNIDDLTSYKKEVEDFVQNDIFFTIESLRAKGFTHEVEGFGFDNIFYENILKRPGRLKTISFASKHFFIKTVNKVDQTDFIRQLMEGDYITLNDLISNIERSLNIRLPFDVVEASLNRLDGFYYETEMNRLFVSKGAYLDYLDR